MKKCLPLLILALLTGIGANAQKPFVPRLSADFGAGIPFYKTTLKASSSTLSHLNLRYGINKTFSVSGGFQLGSFNFKNSSPGTAVVGALNSAESNFRTVKNDFYKLNVKVSMNLRGIIAADAPETKLVPYLSLGGGLLFHSIKATYVDGTINDVTKTSPSKSFRSWDLGLGVKYYMTPTWDLMVGAEYTYLETYFLDNAAYDKSNDGYLNTFFGLNYKLGATRPSQHVEWRDKNGPEIEKDTKKYKRWSFDFGAGVPSYFTTLKPAFSTMIHANLKYGINSTFSVGLGLEKGGIYFKNSSPGTTIVGAKNSAEQNFSVVRNDFNKFSAKLFTNLNGLLYESDPGNKFIPFATVGAGLLYHNITVNYIDGTKENVTQTSPSKSFRVYDIGIGGKYYLNPSLDVAFGTEYNYVETYFMDFAPYDKKYDNYLYTYLALNYKFGATLADQNIDWQNLNAVDKRVFLDKRNYSRLSADGIVGIPYLFTNLSQNIGYIGGLGIRYSYSPTMSLQLRVASVNVSGEQKSPNVTFTGASQFSNDKDVKSFSASIPQVDLNMLINLSQLSDNRKADTKWNYYVLGGMGFMYYSGTVISFVDGSSIDLGNSRKTPFYNTHVGFQARHNINTNWDMVLGTEFHSVASKFVDGTPNDGGSNNYISGFAGISYKIGAFAGHDLIDWSFRPEKKDVPIEKVPVIKQPVAKEEIKEIQKDTTMKVIDSTIVIQGGKDNIQITQAPNEVKPGTSAGQSKTDTVMVAQGGQPADGTKAQIKNKDGKVIATLEINEPGAVISSNTGGESGDGSKKSDPKPKTKSIILDQPVVPADEDITPPPFRYNVVVACYPLNQKAEAFDFRDKLRSRGYEANVYHSPRSKWYRVMTITTDNSRLAYPILRRSKMYIDPQSWMYLYNAH